MPILLVLLLTAACVPMKWPNPLGLEPGASATWSVAAVMVPLLVALALRTWVVRSLRRDAARRLEVGKTYDRIRRALFFLNAGAAAFSILGLGWGAAVWGSLTVSRQDEVLLAPFAELLVPLPYFLIAFGSWLICTCLAPQEQRGPWE